MPGRRVCFLRPSAFPFGLRDAPTRSAIKILPRCGATACRDRALAPAHPGLGFRHHPCSDLQFLPAGRNRGSAAVELSAREPRSPHDHAGALDGRAGADDPPLPFPKVDRSAKGDREPVLHPPRAAVKAPEEMPAAAAPPGEPVAAKDEQSGEKSEVGEGAENPAEDIPDPLEISTAEHLPVRRRPKPSIPWSRWPGCILATSRLAIPMAFSRNGLR